MNSLRLFTLLSLIALLILTSCKCDDPTDIECDNYDPCHGIVAEELDVEFDAYHIRLLSFDDGTDTFFMKVDIDTLVSSRAVYFRARGNASSYKWRIGRDLRLFEGKQVKIDFDGYEGDIEIELEASRLPSTATDPCLLVGDSVITMTKASHVVYVPGVNESVEGDQEFFGHYRGYETDNPEEKFEILVKDGFMDFGDISGDFNWGGIKNFPPDCNHHRDDPSGQGLYGIIPYYNSFMLSNDHIYPTSKCYSLGTGYYDSDTEELRMSYMYFIFDEGGIGLKSRIIDTVKFEFIGKKI